MRVALLPPRNVSRIRAVIRLARCLVLLSPAVIFILIFLTGARMLNLPQMTPEEGRNVLAEMQIIPVICGAGTLTWLFSAVLIWAASVTARHPAQIRWLFQMPLFSVFLCVMNLLAAAGVLVLFEALGVTSHGY